MLVSPRSDRHRARPPGFGAGPAPLINMLLIHSLKLFSAARATAARGRKAGGRECVSWGRQGARATGGRTREGREQPQLLTCGHCIISGHVRRGPLRGPAGPTEGRDPHSPVRAVRSRTTSGSHLARPRAPIQGRPRWALGVGECSAGTRSLNAHERPGASAARILLWVIFHCGSTELNAHERPSASPPLSSHLPHHHHLPTPRSHARSLALPPAPRRLGRTH